MRILLKSGKCIGIQNSQNIQEVESYWYLGVIISQSLKLKEHEIKIRNIEKFLWRRIGILKATMINTKIRLLLFNSIMRSKVSYGCAVIWSHSKAYLAKWESMIYRFLKRLFWMKTNVAKQKLFEILRIDKNNKYTEKDDLWLIEHLSLKII